MSKHKVPTIILTGGGTGGHIVPILAVASELKRLRPDIRLVYVGQAGGVLNDLPTQHPAIDAVYGVRAGKFRRYLGSRWRQALDIRMQLHNLADLFWVITGIWQSIWLVRRLRPVAIFTRGGYVSVPVALAGALWRVPYVTHDSDSTPGLANRLIARWAVAHAVALPKNLYPYPPDTVVEVGVPVSGEYVPVTSKLQHEYKAGLDLASDSQLVLVTGGGNGADALNQLVANALPDLLERHPKLIVVHVAGRALADELSVQYDGLLSDDTRKRVTVKPFLADMYRYSGAADVVVARGGASTLAEFSVQGKACIIIPAPQLSWQIHHAQTLAKHHAIITLSQQDAGQGNRFAIELGQLLDNATKRQELAAQLSTLARRDAATRLAELLLECMHK